MCKSLEDDYSLKTYRENELKYYVLSCIFVFLWIHFNGKADVLEIWTVLEPVLISPVFYIFTILFDALYSSELKFKIVHFPKGRPSRYIFSEILTKKNSPWFTDEEVSETYKDIYNSLSCKSKTDGYDFQDREWYKIYSKYRDKKIESLDINAKEYRMFRDFNIASINLLGLYISYSFLCQELYWKYIIFLLLTILVTNVSARNKGKRWVYNIISYDINHSS